CNDRNYVGRFFGYACCRRAARNDEVNVGGNQFSGEASEPIQLPVPVSALYGDVLALRVAKLAHSLLERIQSCGKLIGAGRQHAYPRYLACLLRARRERPRRSVAEQGDEVASSHAPFRFSLTPALARP